VTDQLRAVDLFCGAGGLSWGLVEALESVAVGSEQQTETVLADAIDLVGVNHWERAIETHEQNHPWARHWHDDVQSVSPREVFDERNPDVKIVSGGPECTHFTRARGGKPVNEQKRMPAWDFLNWVQKLRPEHVLVENVPEFADWGPIDDDGMPTRTGETFESWVDSLHALGYSVRWDVLNAADYGDATSRKRLFILASRTGTPTFPEPTHSNDDGELPDRRPAAEIIDWSDPGGSIWTRDLHDARKRPLKNSTMQRIAEGIRRHCHDLLTPLADVLGELGRDDVKRLREQPIPAAYAATAAQVLDGPFLVACSGRDCVSATPSLTKYYGTSSARPVNAPVDTITSGGQKYGLCVPQLLGQHSNSIARAVTKRSVPTVTAGGKVQLTVPQAYLLRQQSGGVPAAIADTLPTVSAKGAIAKVESQPLVMPRNGARGGLHSNTLYQPDERPLHTVTAKNTDGYLVTPSLVRYSHGGATLGVESPMPTIATEKGGVFALSAPYLCPLNNGRDGQRPRTRRVERPLMTVPASKSPAGLATPLVQPFLDDYEGPPDTLEDALGTVTSRDRFALVVPEFFPWGLDVRYRMLQPRELAAAQGFPADYEFAGTKTEITEQIGNAVPVNLARALVESLLVNTTPALTDFCDGERASVAVADGGEQA
jgi:DNA (cytosine-5)-methyltransferase 1